MKHSIAAVLVLLAVPAVAQQDGASGNGDPEPPQMTYWHNWTDDEGVSRMTECTIEQFELQSISGDADPQWIGNSYEADVTVQFVAQPVDWVGTWHENPAPQFVIPTEGSWFVEAMDGTRQEFGPGDLYFGADQGTTERDGKVGHLSGTVGDAPVTLMLVQFSDAPDGPTPCPFE